MTGGPTNQLTSELIGTEMACVCLQLLDLFYSDMCNLCYELGVLGTFICSYYYNSEFLSTVL